MRVIAGEYRSRILQAPKGMETRPTSDRLRETLFNVLQPRIAGSIFLDLYAGSGAVGIEALSRGAGSCTLVESAAPALRALHANIAALGIRSGVQVDAKEVAFALGRLRKLGATLGVDKAGADLVYIDPPYEAAAEYESTLGYLARNAEFLLRPGALVIAEHHRRKPLEARYSKLERTRVLEQGDAGLSFYVVAGPKSSHDVGID
jgi:16S rRNA (guanine(966)-N(2))-methyltransferase RsmD